MGHLQHGHLCLPHGNPTCFIPSASNFWNGEWWKSPGPVYATYTIQTHKHIFIYCQHTTFIHCTNSIQFYTWYYWMNSVNTRTNWQNPKKSHKETHVNHCQPIKPAVSTPPASSASVPLHLLPLHSVLRNLRPRLWHEPLTWGRWSHDPMEQRPHQLKPGDDLGGITVGTCWK